VTRRLNGGAAEANGKTEATEKPRGAPTGALLKKNNNV